MAVQSRSSETGRPTSAALVSDPLVADSLRRALTTLAAAIAGRRQT